MPESSLTINKLQFTFHKNVDRGKAKNRNQRTMKCTLRFMRDFITSFTASLVLRQHMSSLRVSFLPIYPFYTIFNIFRVYDILKTSSLMV